MKYFYDHIYCMNPSNSLIREHGSTYGWIWMDESKDIGVFKMNCSSFVGKMIALDFVEDTQS